MHVRTLRLDSEPPLVVVLHPALTVVEADTATRVRIVDALERAGRQGAEVHGELHGDGVQLDFATAAAGASPIAAVLSAADLAEGDAEAVALARALDHARARRRRAEARHEDARALVDSLERDGEGTAPVAAERGSEVAERGSEDAEGAGAPPVAELRAARDALGELLASLDAALAAAWDAGRAVPAAEARGILERGTLLASDLSRRGLCGPGGVRAVLEAVDAVAVAPDAPPMVRQASNRAAPALAELDAAIRRGEAGPPGADPRPIAVRAQEARSHALATFAELEAARRAEARAEAAADRLPGLDASVSAGALVLRRRLAGLARPSGDPGSAAPAPVVLDDVLEAFPPGERAELLDELIAASARTQVVYLTDDPEVLAWAAALAPEVGAREPVGARTT